MLETLLGNKVLLPIVLGVVDLIVVWFVFRKVKKQTKNFELFAFKKLIFILVNGIVISYHLGLVGLSIVLGVILGIYPIINLIAYPQEFRNYLDDMKGRKISKGNIQRLLSDKSLDEVTEAIVRSYRQKLSTTIVITRQDVLSDIEKTGYNFGEATILADFIEMCYKHNSELNKGAMVIRDDKVVALNCRLPVIYNEQLDRAGGGNKHLGMFGVVNTSDAVVIGTSGDSGYITIGGTPSNDSSYFRFMVKMQEHDIQNGLTKEEIKSAIKSLLSGVGSPEDYQAEHEKEVEKQRLLEEKAQRKIEKTKNERSKEQKMAERAEARRQKGKNKK